MWLMKDTRIRTTCCLPNTMIGALPVLFHKSSWPLKLSENETQKEELGLFSAVGIITKKTSDEVLNIFIWFFVVDQTIGVFE